MPSQSSPGGHNISRLTASAVIILIATLLPSSASALTALSQGYSTEAPLSIGSLVSLKKGSNDAVEPSVLANSDSIIGVVVNPDGSLLSVSNSAGQAQVATSGVANLIVSDINGEIIQGDQITASPIKGVGMKATSNTKVIGIAQDKPSYDNKKHEYTTESGIKESFKLGQIPIVISVSYYTKAPEKTVIPHALQNIANSVAGKKVSTLPILISSAIFLIMLIAVVSIIYSLIRSSIISIGRNPLAQSAVFRDVIQLSALVVIIIGVSLLAIYFILTKL